MHDMDRVKDLEAVEITDNIMFCSTPALLEDTTNHDDDSTPTV